MSWQSTDLPPRLVLRRFCLGSAQNTLVLFDTLDPADLPLYSISEEPVVKSSFVKIYEVFDQKDQEIGAIVKYGQMQSFEFGEFYVKMSRYQSLSSFSPVSIWTGNLITLYEGEQGCVLFNSCPQDTIASDMMELI